MNKQKRPPSGGRFSLANTGAKWYIEENAEGGKLMLRLLKESLTRRIFDLDGMWHYCADPEGNSNWKDGLPECKKAITIPGCFNNEPGMLNYEGDVWMQTEFLTERPNIRLVFGAVNNDCDVYLDGKHLGHHWGPFTEFSYTLQDLAPGSHMLVLRVNNLHNEQDTIPLSNVDWFHYGGIIHSVEVHEFEAAAIEAMKLEYSLHGTTAKLTAKLSLMAFEQVVAPIRLCLDGKVLAEETVTLSGKGEVSLCATLDNVKLWSPEDPNLYTFSAEFAGDTLQDRTGFRTIEIKDRQFLLNGKPIYFQGVNRHEEHPEWGFAVPLKLAKRDIDIIQGMGCNFLRGSHYPNAKTTLDYMDETGMLFWEEIPMWQFKEEHLSNPIVLDRGCYLHTQMVTRDYNHPCIVVWGLFNEVSSESAPAPNAAKQFRAAIEAVDTSRLITYASHRPFNDLCYDFADFISINYYAGWYYGPLTKWPEVLQQITDYADSTGNGHKPIVMSEFGAGGIAGDIELEEDVFWSENYQSNYLEYTLQLFKDHPRIHGALIWQFCDIRAGAQSCASGIRRILSRPRSFNNKGILNEFRRPKLAYHTVKKIFTSKD